MVYSFISSTTNFLSAKNTLELGADIITISRDSPCAQGTCCLIGILADTGYLPSTMYQGQKGLETTCNCPSLEELGYPLGFVCKNGYRNTQ